MSREEVNKSQDQIRKDRERYMVRKHLETRYKVRFTIAKEGKSALNRKDYRTMAFKYNEYLKILAETYEVKEIYDLRPSHFDLKKDVTELLIISQVFWELVKLYDNSSKSTDKMALCLKQFVAFTVNMSYQTLNTEIVRKELKRRKFKQLPLLKKGLETIYKESKGCFVATYYDTHPNDLQLLREFKFNFLLKNEIGKKFVNTYYSVSPSFIELLEKHYILKNLFLPFIKFSIFLIVFLIKITK